MSASSSLNVNMRIEDKELAQQVLHMQAAAESPNPFVRQRIFDSLIFLFCLFLLLQSEYQTTIITITITILEASTQLPCWAFIFSFFTILSSHLRE